MTIKVAEYVSQFLLKNGITDCFIVTGGGAMHLDDALGHQPGLRCVFNHHEQACAIAAEAYARLTGRVAAVCVTSGPGGTNAITGVVGGWLDSIPMFVVSGQVKRETTIAAVPALRLRQLGDQEFDIVGSVANMTKYAVQVREPLDIAYHLEKALHLALSGRKGPVWLDIPLDVQGARVEESALRHFSPDMEETWMPPELCEETARMILEKVRAAKRPLVLLGTGVRLAGAENAARQLLEKWGVPAVTAWNANDLLAYGDPHFAGMPGTVGTRPGNFAVQNCDLLLSLGCRLNIRMIGYNHHNFAKNAYKILIDIDPNELAKPTVRPDLAVCADARQALDELLALPFARVSAHETWRLQCRAWIEKYPAVLPQYHKPDASPVNPYVFIDRLFGRLSDEDRIVCGNGSACVITFQAGKIKQGQRMFTNSGCAAMGYGFPAAVGVAVADNSRRTICIDGDGSFMMNIQELATVAQNRLDVKIFILNNNGYHSIRQTQRNLFKPPFVGIDSASGVGFPDFCRLAESFGVKSFKVSAETDCDDVLTRVLGWAGPCVCEVGVDPGQDFAPKSSSKVHPDGRITSTSLEDMAPFLPEDELRANMIGECE